MTKSFEVFNRSDRGYHSTVELPESVLSPKGTPPLMIIVDGKQTIWGGSVYVRFDVAPVQVLNEEVPDGPQ